MIDLWSIPVDERKGREVMEISNLAQGLWKDETHNWNEDELLELVVAQFGDRVLPDEWKCLEKLMPY